MLLTRTTQVLQAMPAKQDLLRSSSLYGTVTSDRLTGHANRVIKDAAAALVAKWQGRPLPSAKPAPAPAAAAHEQGAAARAVLSQSVGHVPANHALLSVRRRAACQVHSMHMQDA